MRQVFLAIFLSALLFAKNSLADFQTITTYSDLEGHAFGNQTDRRILNSFGEYPLSKTTSIGEISQISYNKSTYNSGTSAYALNYLELFHRHKFYNGKYVGITMHNSYKFGGIYNENKNLGLMPNQPDYEFRLLFGHNMPDRLVNTVVQNETPYFARAEIAYRRCFSNPFDEYRFTLWAGLRINNNFSFLLQDNIIWNVNAKATALDNSRTNFANFQYSKNANNIATFSLLYHYDRSTAFQFGYLRRLSGNAPFYNYDGISVALWKTF